MDPIKFKGPDGDYEVSSDNYNVTLHFRPKGKKNISPIAYLRDFPAVGRHLLDRGFHTLPGNLEETIRGFEKLQESFLKAVDERLGTDAPLPGRFDSSPPEVVEKFRRKVDPPKRPAKKVPSKEKVGKLKFSAPKSKGAK